MRLIATALIFVIASAALSTAQSPAIVNLGAGSQSCGRWMAIRADGKNEDSALVRGMILSWVQGFLVGTAQIVMVLLPPAQTALADRQKRFGTVSGWMFDLPDGDAVSGWLDSYCREHPLEKIEAAANALTEELVSKKR